jgi:hypothetical protein
VMILNSLSRMRVDGIKQGVLLGVVRVFKVSQFTVLSPNLCAAVWLGYFVLARYRSRINN